MTLTIDVPEGCSFVQALLQLTGTPDSSVQLQVSGATLAPVPSPYDTYAHAGNLTDGAGLVTLPDRFNYIEIANNDSSSGLWVSTDGSRATIGGDDVDVVPPGKTALFANGLQYWWQGFGACDDSQDNPGTVISMISASPTAAYSIQGR